MSGLEASAALGCIGLIVIFVGALVWVDKPALGRRIVIAGGALCAPLILRLFVLAVGAA